MVSRLHRDALALVDELADVGARLAIDPDGVIATRGAVPDALGARLAGLLGEGEHRAAFPAYRALWAILAAPTRAARELLTVPVACARLPVAFVLRFQRGTTQAQFTTWAAAYARDRGKLAQFVARELDVMAQAYRQGRAHGVHLDAWIAAKRRGGEWSLTAEVADVLPGAAADDGEGLTFGELLDGLGAALVGVEMQGAA